MKYFAIPFLVLTAITLSACNKTQEEVTDILTAPPTVATETSQPAENTTPPADLNEPDLTQKYQAYSAEKMAMLKGEQKFGIFFHADWCPTCVKWEERTSAMLEQLPESTLILKADYDTETELVKALHVKKQSTMVWFNAKGEIVDAVSDPSVEAIAKFFMTPQIDVLSQAGERYVAFNQAEFDAQIGNEKLVVFFHADWCGTCRKWEKNLQENLDQLSPEARILKANFDTESDLREVFGVTKQSTAVFLEADGSVAKTEGDPSLESLNAFFGV